MVAQSLLAAVQAAVPSVDGFTIRDPALPITWTFFGKTVTPADAATAVTIIQATLTTVAPSLEDRVTALERRLNGV